MCGDATRQAAPRGDAAHVLSIFAIRLRTSAEGVRLELEEEHRELTDRASNVMCQNENVTHESCGVIGCPQCRSPYAGISQAS